MKLAPLLETKDGSAPVSEKKWWSPNLTEEGRNGGQNSCRTTDCVVAQTKIAAR